MVEYNVQNRGGKGIKTMQVTEKTGRVAGLKMVDGTEDVVLMDNNGTIIRFAGRAGIRHRTQHAGCTPDETGPGGKGGGCGSGSAGAGRGRMATDSAVQTQQPEQPEA